MKKILSFFAIGAIVLGMASCGGNEPEVKDFDFLISALAHSVHIDITPSQEDVYYLISCDPASEIEKAGGLENFIKNNWTNHSFEFFEEIGVIKIGHDEYNLDEADPETKYIAYAVYVKNEASRPVIIGKIVSEEFTTPAAEK